MLPAATVCVGTAIWLSLGILTVTSAEGGVRIAVLPPWWVLLLSIAATFAIVRVTRLSPRARRPLFLSLVLWLPWLPLPIPTLFLVFTGPMVVLVWAGIAMLVFVTGGWAAKVAAADPFRNPRRASRTAGAIAFVVFFLVWFAQPASPTGDEPHYLLLTQSLLLDHDVKVGNNYERGDYRPYYAGTIQPHVAQSPRDGELYSFHSPGLSVLIAPAFAAGGYRAVVVVVTLLASVATALVWKAGYALTGSLAAAWFGWAVVALTSPGALHGSLVYPDSLAGLILTAALLGLIVLDSDTSRRPDTRMRGVALDAGIALLPWLHVRLALPAFILTAIFLLRTPRRVTLLIPIAISVVMWLLFFFVTFGTINPAAPYGDRIPLELRNLTSGLTNMLTDQQFGLVANGPVYLLALAGIAAVFKRSRRLGVEFLLIVVPYVMVSSAYPAWWGGASPPARFLVPMIFPLGVAAAAWWARQHDRGEAIGLTLLGVSTLVAGGLAFGGDGTLAYNLPTGRAKWVDWAAPLLDVPRALPSGFRKAGAATVAPNRPWIRATDTQLELLRRMNPRVRPVGFQPFPPRLLSGAEVATRLAITTSPFDAGMSPLFLRDVPPGRYRLQPSSPQGGLTYGIGHATVPIPIRPAAGTDGHDLLLPITASTLNVGDATSRERLALVPVGLPDPDETHRALRARNAALYGTTVVYTVDERVALERSGFWVLGARRPDIVFASDPPAGLLSLELRNGPVANRVALQAGAWQAERALAPDERWPVQIPVAASERLSVVNFNVETGFRPADVDPASRDRRLLGVWVEVR